MANGQRFQALGLSAASRTLPLGTRVPNLGNGRQLILHITDRSPDTGGRLLDSVLAS